MQNTEQPADQLVIGGHAFTSRFILGSGKYSLTLIEAAIRERASRLLDGEGGAASELDFSRWEQAAENA